MSGVVGLALTLLLAAEAPSRSGPADGAPQADEGAPAPPSSGRARRDRSVGDELPLAAGGGDERVPTPWRPALLVPRNPAVAAVLGGVVGFGSGLHYAGEPAQGVAFGVADGVLLTGLGVLEVVLNRDALERDYEVGKSLGRGERSMTGHEKTLAAGAWITGGLLVASHVAQVVLGLRAARRYDATLEQVSCVPLGGDVAPR